MDARTTADWDAMVEAIRVGTVFAHDDKQHRKWRSSKPRTRSAPLKGAALEAAVMRLGQMFPDNVIAGGPA